MIREYFLRFENVIKPQIYPKFMTYQITQEENPNADDLQVLSDGLNKFVRALFPDNSVGTSAFFLRDPTGTLVGGVAGNYGSFGWMYVDSLWVSEELRGQGYGTSLMEAIEAEAVRHGCANIYVNTFSFEAPVFYERLGYSVFAELEDFPVGHSRLFLRKALSK